MCKPWLTRPHLLSSGPRPLSRRVLPPSHRRAAGDRLVVMEHPFGIDFGGTGIKGAPVDLEIGDFAAERERFRTPEKSTPDNVAQIFVDLLAKFPDCKGPVGVTVPGVV